MTIGRVFYVSCEACVIASLLRLAHHCAAVRPPAKSDRRARPLILAQSRSASGLHPVGPPLPPPARVHPPITPRPITNRRWHRPEPPAPWRPPFHLGRHS